MRHLIAIVVVLALAGLASANPVFVQQAPVVVYAPAPVYQLPPQAFYSAPVQFAEERAPATVLRPVAHLRFPSRDFFPSRTIGFFGGRRVVFVPF